MANHPITPPPELVQQWGNDSTMSGVPYNERFWTYEEHIANAAARWGSDQELESCIELLKADGYKALASPLRAARRPKPPSLKAQALAALDDAVMRGDCITISDAVPTIRRALEALND